MLLVPQLLCWLGLMALGTVHTSPSAAEVKLERGNCPQSWFSFNGRCFKYIPKLLHFNDAEKNCMSEGGHLASIHSAAEDNFVLQLIHTMDSWPKQTWIGLNDQHVEGRWMWTDFSTVRYTGWDRGQPNEGRNANCVKANWVDGSKWADTYCTSKSPSVCVRT